MDELIFKSAVALSQAIRRREVSSSEVVKAYLQRIEAINPEINAVVQLAADRVLVQAKEADVSLARGEIVGPLHGVPFTVKDIFDTQGLVNAAGLPERAHDVSREDATVVARMRAAGALLLGKSNCPPYGSGGECVNPLYGRTNNPYDLTRTPGGSSGGEAALLAAGGSPLGIGSDSGGSIRVPAHYCGIAGLLPTSGRVPCTGGYELPGGLRDPRTQVGPMARFVEDLELALSIISGVDWRDSAVIPMPLGDLKEVALRSLRVAFFTNDGIASPTAETVEVVQTTASRLSEEGLFVDERRPPGIEESLEISEGYWRHQQMNSEEIELLMNRWDEFRTRMLTFMERYDVVLCPASNRPAQPHETTTVEQFSYTLPYSLTGYPCVVVRAGTSSEQLPLDVQIVARPWRENVALAVASYIEQTLCGWLRPPL